MDADDIETLNWADKREFEGRFVFCEAKAKEETIEVAEIEWFCRRKKVKQLPYCIYNLWREERRE